MNSPKVSIVITSYWPESKPYLDLCVESCKNLDYNNYEIIIVGKPSYKPDYPSARTVSPEKEEFYPPVGLNLGANCADPGSKYFLFINDDTILTRNSLAKLVRTYSLNPGLGLLMPVGNDQQGLYHFPMAYPGKINFDVAQRQFSLIKDLDSPYPQGVIFQQTLCLYAVLVSRGAWNKIGPFDATLIGNDDVDYSWRSVKAGYTNAISTDALVFHFGGVSTSTKWNAELRAKSLEIFNAKWKP